MRPVRTRPRKPLPPMETALVCQQMAMMLKAGIALPEAADALAEHYAGTRHERMFREIATGVQRSGSLFGAIEALSYFPAYAVGMVRVGEAAGRLDDVLDDLNRYYAREQRLRSAVRTAVVYPAVLTAMMAAVIAVMVIKVLPLFDRAFGSLGAQMSPTAVAVMQFGMAAGRVVLAALGAALLILAVVAILTRTSLRDRLMDALKSVFPAAGRISALTAAARFTSVLSMLLAAGHPVEQARDLVAGVMSEGRDGRKAMRSLNDIANGEPIASAAEKSGLLEPIHARMLAVGASSGRLDEALRSLAGLEEEQADEAIQSLVALIEPVLVAVLALAIGGILMSVMLPLASIMSSML